MKMIYTVSIRLNLSSSPPPPPKKSTLQWIFPLWCSETTHPFQLVQNRSHWWSFAKKQGLIIPQRNKSSASKEPQNCLVWKRPHKISLWYCDTVIIWVHPFKGKGAQAILSSSLSYCIFKTSSNGNFIPFQLFQEVLSVNDCSHY